MAEFLSKTVAPSGGDYTSLEACMNANEQDLTGDGWFTVIIDGTWESADTSAVTIHNYTTTADDYINIYTTAACRHPGYFSNASPYYRIVLDPNLVSVITIDDEYVTLTGIQSQNTDSDNDYRNNALRVSEDYVTIDKHIGKASGSSYRGIGGVSGNSIRNSVFISSLRSAIDIDGQNCYLYNSVFVCLDGTNSPGTVYDGGGFYNATNCYAYIGAGGSNYAFDGSPTGVTTCASNDGSESSATVAYSTSSGAYFTNVTAGSEDFHITSTSSDLYNAGTDLSGTFTDDIDGDTRTAWDIGVDYIEGVVSGTTVIVSPISLNFMFTGAEKNNLRLVLPALSLIASIVKETSLVTNFPNAISASLYVETATVSIGDEAVTVEVSALTLAAYLTGSTSLVIKIPDPVASIFTVQTAGNMRTVSPIVAALSVEQVSPAWRVNPLSLSATTILSDKKVTAFPNPNILTASIESAGNARTANPITMAIRNELANPAWGVDPLSMTFSIPEVTVIIPDVTIKVAALSLNALLNSTTPLVIKIPSEIAMGIAIPSQGAKVSKEPTVIEATFTQTDTDKAITKEPAPIEMSVDVTNQNPMVLAITQNLSLNLFAESLIPLIIKEASSLELDLINPDATVSLVAPPITISIDPLILTFTLQDFKLSGIIPIKKWYAAKHNQNIYTNTHIQEKVLVNAGQVYSTAKSNITKRTGKHRFR